MKSLHNVWTADLVHNDVDFILQGQRPELVLATPSGILLHILAVHLEWVLGFVLQLLHIRPKVILVRRYVLHGVLAVLLVLVLVALKLIGEGPKQAIPVTRHRVYLESLLPELSLKSIRVFLLINLIEG